METRSRSPGRNTRARPRRKSPVYVASGKKSPSNKSPSRKSPSRRSPDKSIKEKTIENTKSSTLDRGRPSPTRNLKVRLDKITSTQIKSSRSSDTIDIGSSILSPRQRPPSSVSVSKPDDTSGDSEIAKITSIAPLTRRSVSTTKLTPSTHHLTPTPSATATTDQLSRHSRSASRSVYDASKTEYSDNEDDEKNDDGQSSYSNYRPGDLFKNSYTAKLGSVSRFVSVPREFGGAFGAGILLCLIPIVSYYLQWSCDKTNACNFKKISVPTTKVEAVSLLPNLNTFERIFTKNTVIAYIIYTSGLFIVSGAIRVGLDVKLPPSDRGIIRYHFNAIAISTLATIALIVGEILQYSIANFILKNYLKFMLFNILNALILALWCFIRSRFVPQNQWNSYGKTGNFIMDFSIGREINPKWFQLFDIKLLCYRTSLITTLLLLEILVYRNIQLPKVAATTDAVTVTADAAPLTTLEFVLFYYKNTNLTDFSALFSALLVLVYIFDSIIYEHHLATSFELQQEGVGAFLLLRYAITPFLLVAVPKYVFDKRPLNLPLWMMMCASIILILGLLLKRKSNSIKYRYRMDPYNRELAFMDTVPTFQGKRLLLGKLWGTIRQPNYAGDILALISITLPLYGKFAWPPLLSVLLIIAYLLHRAHRVNSRNFARYNSAWQRYCTKVRYMIIPKVY